MHSTIAFANDWADDLAVKTSVTVPADARLPATPSITVLANLNNIAITLSGNAVTVSPGLTPPSGGGFEVRRRDDAFMPGEDTDSCCAAGKRTWCCRAFRQTTASISVCTTAAMPPNYSEFAVIEVAVGAWHRR